MSVISPTTCGFAKIAAFNIFTGDKLVLYSDEDLAMYRSREIKHQFDLWQEQFVGYNEQFNVKYEIFKKYHQKIVDMRNLAKKRSVDKGIVMYAVIFTKKME